MHRFAAFFAWSAGVALAAGLVANLLTFVPGVRVRVPYLVPFMVVAAATFAACIGSLSGGPKAEEEE